MIPAGRAHLHVAAVSHPGMSGKNNEDRYAVSAFRLEDAASTPSLLAIVADGIGGHRAGEIAAEIAVETISRMVAVSDGSQPVKTLQDAIIQAAKTIHEEAEANTEQKGMGSTCACAWVIGSQLYTASVGDSRIYLVRANTIRQLSTDHTWVQEAIEQGMLRPEQARGHPNAHVIRRYLGARSGVTPDMRLKLIDGEDDVHALANQGTALQPGDMLLLCSDGLTDLVDDVEILAAIQTRRAEGALEELTNLSNQRGGHDNITMVMLSMPSIEQPTIPIAVRKSRSRLAVLAAGGLVFLVLLISLVTGAAWLMKGRGGPVVTEPSIQVEKATLFPAPAYTESPGSVPTTHAPATLPSVGSPMPESGTTPLPGNSSGAATLTPWPTNTPPAPLSLR